MGTDVRGGVFVWRFPGGVAWAGTDAVGVFFVGGYVWVSVDEKGGFLN